MKPLLFILLYMYGIAAVYAHESCSTFPDDAVRLQGFHALNISLAGRVEICRNGVWGTVCGDSAFTPWSEKNAQVVCRQLGFSGALNSILHDRLPLEVRVPEDTPIHLSGVECLGHENALDNCTSRGNPATCTHVQDVAITCRPNGGLGENGEIGDIRLIGDIRNGYGAVQLRDFRTGFIGICPDDGTFDTTEANIVCRQLGYDSGSVMEFSGDFDREPFFLAIKAQGFSCGPEDSFTTSPTCNYDLTTVCSTSSLAGVACVRSDLPDSSIRLFGGTNRREGRVEILINGRWGSICSTGWDNVDGQVACRELGFGTDRVGTSPVPGSTNRIQPIWLGQLGCSSTSGNLDRCLHLEPTGYADCYNPDSAFAYLDCDHGEPGPQMLSAGAIVGIVIAVIVVLLFIFSMIYMEKLKEVWNKRESYTVYRCLVCPFQACSRYINNCYERNQSPSLNTNARTTGDTDVVFSLNRVPAATHTTETTTNRSNISSSESESEPELEQESEPAPEPEIECDEREGQELIKPDPLSYQAASDLPAINPTDLPPPYPGPPNPVGAYPFGGPAYPPTGGLAYPPAAVPGASLQGYPPPTQAGVDYPPTLEPVATTADSYPVELLQQHAPIDPVLAEELANAPREILPGSLL